MSNLLSPKDKKEIKREYLLRLMAVATLFLGMTMVVALILSLPSYFLSSSKVELVSDRVDFLKSYIKKRQESNVTLGLLKTNEKIEALQNINENRLSESIQLILNEKTESIKITGITLRETGDNGRDIFVSGMARNRDSLISFRDSLKLISFFVEVDLPISNLAKNQNIDFNLRIRLRSAQVE
jgi:hypothetical protein